MENVKNAFKWASVPLLILAFVFGVIFALNWQYEIKLVTLRTDTSAWPDAYLGPLLLAGAAAMSLAAAILLFLVRFFLLRSGMNWIAILPITFITVVFIFPSLFIIVLAPASVTMIQQMKSVQH